MYGELTDKETVARVEYALEHQQHDQFEILLYKKNSEYTSWQYNAMLSTWEQSQRGYKLKVNDVWRWIKKIFWICSLD